MKGEQDAGQTASMAFQILGRCLKFSIENYLEGETFTYPMIGSQLFQILSTTSHICLFM
jgi:hypothetical protein